MSKKHNTKVPNFGSAPKQIGVKSSVAPAQPAKPAPSALTMKPRATSSKSGHRGK
jgi:hypothetical protein